MVSAAGRGKPRPLLAGVFRKACDYCVRSKRGCNGGTPCEQCIRREQPCTYSQRRKSGPRGRPIRQQSATPPPPCAMLGVRTSSRRTKGTSSFSARDGSPEPSTVSSASSSPNRVASLSSSSSPSDYSASDDSFSDSETEAFTKADQERQQKEARGVMEEEEEEKVPMQSGQKAKKSKISGPEDVRKTVREVSPPVPPAVSPKMETATAAAGPTAAAAAAATVSTVSSRALVVPRPQLAAVSFSRPSAMVESGSVRAKKEVAWQPRTLSPSTVAPPSLHHHRAPGSSWTQPLLASATSTRAQQQQQQPHRSSGGVEVVLPAMTPLTPTMSSTSSSASTTSITSSSNNGGASIHEISMQPWEFSRPGGPRAVIASPPALLLPSTTGNFCSSLAGVSMDLADVSLVDEAAASEAGPMPMPTSAVLRRGTPTSSPSSSPTSFDGALRLEGEDFEVEDFDVGLECAAWEMPSLTREMSLVRVVEALGGEHSTHLTQGIGFGFEGSLVSGW